MSVVLFGSRYLKIESALGIAGTLDSPRSASIWVKRAGTTALGNGLGRDERIVTFGQSLSSVTNHCSATFASNDDCQAETTVNSVSDYSQNNTKIEDIDTWHHVVVTFTKHDGSGGTPSELRCWVDGVQDDDSTGLDRTGSSTPMAGFWVGADSGTWLGTSSNLTLNGKVAYCAVFDCILSAAEIASLGTKTPDTMVYDTNSSANLRAYWPLVADLDDDSGNNYHLTSYDASATASPVYDPDDDNPTLDGTPPDPPAAATLPPFVYYYQD